MREEEERFNALPFEERFAKTHDQLAKEIKVAEERLKTNLKAAALYSSGLQREESLFLSAQLKRGEAKIEEFFASNPSEETIAAKRADIRSKVERARKILTTQVEEQLVRVAKAARKADTLSTQHIAKAERKLEEALSRVQKVDPDDTVEQNAILHSLDRAIWNRRGFTQNDLTLVKKSDKRNAARRKVLKILGLEPEAENGSFREFYGRKTGDQVKEEMIEINRRMEIYRAKRDPEFRIFLKSYLATRTTESPSTNAPKESIVESHGEGSINGAIERHGSASYSSDLANGKAFAAAEGAMFLGVRAHGRGHVSIGSAIRGEAEGTAEAGLYAKGSAEGSLDWKAGTVDVGAQGEVFAGVKAEGTANIDISNVGSVEGSGSVGVGIGLKGHVRAGCVKGKCRLKLGLGVFCGIGGDVTISVSMDFPGLMKKMARGVRKALEKFKNVLKRLSRAVKSLGRRQRKKSGRQTAASRAGGKTVSRYHRPNRHKLSPRSNRN